MDAPLLELILRGLAGAFATIAFVSLAIGIRHSRGSASAPLLAYLTAVVGMNALWRWYILWVGFQHDHDGSYARDIEPVVRSMGSALLILLYLGIALVAYFHAKRVLSARERGSG